MPDIYPLPLPRQQLPQPTDRLSDGFLHGLPAPVLLTMPSKLALATADFTPLPQKHIGSINRGVTPSPGGWGTLSTRWNTDGSTGYLSFPNVVPAGDSTAIVVFSIPATPSGTCSVFECATSSGSFTQMLALRVASGTTNIQAFWRFGGTNALLLSSITLNTTYHVTMVRTGNTAILYLNAANVGSQAVTGSTPPATAIQTGKSWDSSPVFQKVGLNLFEMHQSAFSATQVLDHYNAVKTGEPFQLFQPQTAAMMLGTAAAPAITSPGWFIGGGFGSFIGC